MNPQERRQSIRASSRLVVIFKNLKTGKVRRALTKDISASGMRLITEELLESGTPLDIEVKLPDRDTPMAFTAEVIWSQPVGEPRKSYQNPTAETGVKFVRIDAKDQTLLNQYVKLSAPPSQTT